ncbi:MAG: FKBP-type peptidyl-prolyl cis-trans isomerase [Bacteroidales bacterium]|nr:FKBP-type peptidyl-prolyl cis-trans isomerase [Bacteroidales bacterium]MBQ4298814.1 FKBP-type peptidyl-prolyl cis-trans isomerase [Bacteroidales bacterium]
MRFSKIIATLSAAVLVVACGSPAQEGSKDTLALLPSSSQIDSASYLIGVNFGSWIKGNNFGELNYSQIVKGMKDWMKAEGNPQDSTFFTQFKIDPNEMNTVLDNFVQKRRAYSKALNEEKGAAYVAEFLKEEGTQQTESGIAYKIIEPGNDVKAVSDKDTVWVNYKGTHIDGSTFDENDDINFSLNHVIKGWTEGMKLVGEGGHVILVIPGELAYGEYGNRGIGPNETLVFDVTLNKVGAYVEPVAAPEKPAKKGRK